MNEDNVDNGKRTALARAFMTRQAGFELLGAVATAMVPSIAMVYLESREHLPLGPIAFSLGFATITATSFLGMYTRNRHGSDELSKCCAVIWFTAMACALLVTLAGEFSQLSACGTTAAFLIAKVLMFGNNPGASSTE